MDDFLHAAQDDFCFVSGGWRAWVSAILYLGGYCRFSVTTQVVNHGYFQMFKS